MMSELVSIIIPVYNVEKYLQACVESVMNQTYTNIEIILVDDGSTDSSGAMCDNLKMQDSRIHVIHKKNGGLSDARNIGLESSKGDYVVFIDSDDIVSHKLVDYLYSLLKKTNSEIAICNPVHCYPDMSVEFSEETHCFVYNSEEAITEMLYQKSFLVAAWGKIYKKKFFTDIKFPYGMLFEDSAIMYKIFDQANRVAYGNACLYGYMHRGNSITTRRFDKRDCDILVISKDIVSYFCDRSQVLFRSAISYQTNAALRILLNAPKTKDFESVILECKDIVKNNFWKVCFDKNVRTKLRLGLILVRFFELFVPFIYKRIDRWK